MDLEHGQSQSTYAQREVQDPHARWMFVMTLDNTGSFNEAVFPAYPFILAILRKKSFKA